MKIKALVTSLLMASIMAGCGGKKEAEKPAENATTPTAPVATSTGGKDQLHLYNWNNYIAPETVKSFEEFCKCTLVQSYYSDNDEMLAKLQAGAKGYDILVPTGNALQTLVKMNAIQPIDKKQLPNLKNVDPNYMKKMADQFDKDNTYAVPYAYTTTILGFQAEKLKELGLPTDTWALIFDPKNLEKIKGKVTVLDSANELLAAALIYKGYPATDNDPKHLKEASEVIKKAKPYWAAFNASSYIKELTVGNIWVAHGYSNDLFQAAVDAKSAGRKFTIDFKIPKEGATFSIDSMVVHKEAPRPDLAHKFINFMLDGKNASALTNSVGSGNPNADALQYVKPEIAKNTAIFPDAEQLKKVQMLNDFTAEQRKERDKLWTSIKLN